MKDLSYLEQFREELYGMRGDEHNGAFRVFVGGKSFNVIASNGGTEYVSRAGNDQRAIYFIPTPRAQNIKTSEKAKRESKSSPGLADYIQMFPTPKASDYKGSGPAGSKSAEHDLKKHNLKGVVMFYPTPTTGAGLRGGERRAAQPGLGGVDDGLSAWMDRGMSAPGYWMPEPDGVPRITQKREHRSDRLKCLGNAVVPQQFYPIFQAIADIERGIVHG